MVDEMVVDELLGLELAVEGLDTLIGLGCREGLVGGHKDRIDAKNHANNLKARHDARGVI